MGFGNDRFKNPPPDALLCDRCQELCDDPLQCNEDSHIFCRSCVHDVHDGPHSSPNTNATRSNPLCPSCPPDKAMPLSRASKPIQRLIGDLIVNCLNRSAGCDETYKISAQDEHLAACQHQVSHKQLLPRIERLQIDVERLQIDANSNQEIVAALIDDWDQVDSAISDRQGQLLEIQALADQLLANLTNEIPRTDSKLTINQEIDEQFKELKRTDKSIVEIRQLLAKVWTKTDQLIRDRAEQTREKEEKKVHERPRPLYFGKSTNDLIKHAHEVLHNENLSNLDKIMVAFEGCLVEELRQKRLGDRERQFMALVRWILIGNYYEEKYPEDPQKTQLLSRFNQFPDHLQEMIQTSKTRYESLQADLTKLYEQERQTTLNCSNSNQ